MGNRTNPKRPKQAVKILNVQDKFQLEQVFSAARQFAAKDEKQLISLINFKAQLFKKLGPHIDAAPMALPKQQVKPDKK